MQNRDRDGKQSPVADKSFGFAVIIYSLSKKLKEVTRCMIYPDSCFGLVQDRG